MRANREEQREYQQNAGDALRVAWLLGWKTGRDLAIVIETRDRMKGLQQDAETRGRLIDTVETIWRAADKTGEGLEKLDGNSIKKAWKDVRLAFTLLSEARNTQNDLIRHMTGNRFRDTAACLWRCERAIEEIGRAMEFMGRC